MLRKSKRPALFVSVLLAVVLVPQASAAPETTPQWVGLANGKVGDYVWSVKAKPAETAAVAQRDRAERPCVSVGTTWQIGPYNYRRSQARRCVSASNGLSASEPPLIASGAQPSTGAAVKMTAVGMIFAPAARHVRITFSDQSTRTLPLRLLPLDRAREAGLGRFRYAAFAVHGTWCVERLVSVNATGETLWDSGVDDFSCTGPPPRLRRGF